MNFETMDWEVEAQRVAAAFGIYGLCYFHYYSPDQTGWWKSESVHRTFSTSEHGSGAACSVQDGPFRWKTLREDWLRLEIVYTKSSRLYRLQKDFGYADGLIAGLKMGWDGRIIFVDGYPRTI